MMKESKKVKRSLEVTEEGTTSPGASTSASDHETAKKSKKQKSGYVYVEHEKVSGMAEEDIQKFRTDNNITVTTPDDATFNPVLKFKYAGYDDTLLVACEGFKRPTPIQSQCWPISLSGRDLIGIAETGSGKTIAFALPSLQRAYSAGLQTVKGSPQVLVLAPTRELAMQSQEVYEKAGSLIGAKSVCVYGGVDKHEQKQLLKSVVHVIIATPGRLLGFIREGVLSLSSVTCLVLDEADRMLDMGFEEDMRKIMGFANNSKRQTLMFSATWPASIQAIASEYLSSPVKVTIGSPDLAASQNVRQVVEIVDQQNKFARLDALLRQYHDRKNRILIFALYKKEVARVESYLKSRGWTVCSVHGDKNQNQRSEALAQFKDGSHPLMVATDVAGRGLDIPNVEYVINVTFPLTIEDYVHRIGRTGRGGATGVSHTLFTILEKPLALDLIEVLQSAAQDVPAALCKLAGVAPGQRVARGALAVAAAEAAQGADGKPVLIVGGGGKASKKKKHDVYGEHFKEVDPNVKGTRTTFDSDEE